MRRDYTRRAPGGISCRRSLMARVAHAVPRTLRVALSLTLTSFAGLGLGACADSGMVTNYHVPEDVGAALEQLPKITTVEVGTGGIPYFVGGVLGRSESFK